MAEAGCTEVALGFESGSERILGEMNRRFTLAESLHLDSLKITGGIRIYPGTPLARRAVRDGMLSGDGDLLSLRFYLAHGLDPWIYERVARFESGA
jgi:hypothetical protein